MKRLLLFVFLISPMLLPAQQPQKPAANPPIYIAFLWHMHQPIYWPYETVVQTDQNGRYSYSVADIHNQRIGPYTSWPKNAVQTGIDAGLQHLGAQVSFSGSLIENLNNLEGAGNGNFTNWKSSWNYIKNQTTSLGNPRIDMVGFGYHHPLMGLIDYTDIRKQVQAHKAMFQTNFPGTYSKGIFPPENAFSPREIPALVDEGFQWVLVDNVHFDRACQGYPYNTGGNLYEPNKADQRNANPNDWIQLNGLWAPTLNSARWGREPHYAEYIDPNTGIAKKIIAVPCDRYMGNEDGRGGFGALNYDGVMSQLEPYNTDPQHPILIVLHHDGDNYGGGTDSYYGSNFQNFVNWLLANPSRFVCTTVQDYLQMFPPDTSDVIHIEEGSWSGADNGDPEFLKWNGDPSGGYSPDRNSWGIITAAKNMVLTAEQINPASPNTQNAWHYFLNGEASDYWYWDGSQGGLWDSHPARASNLAIPYAQAVIATGTDLTPPTIYIPQRQPYNPGGTEWNINQPSDFTVWTYAYDVSGLKSVTLKYRTSTNTTVQAANETYAGGAGTGNWTNLAMTGTSIASQTNPLPLAKAKEYSAQVTGFNTILLDYYVEAVDSNNNTARSPIRHVWVGANSTGGGGTTGVSWVPTSPTENDSIKITVSGATQGALFHWGVNNAGSSWVQPNAAYWPAGSSLFSGTGPAVQSPMAGPDTAHTLTLTIGPFNNPAQNVQRVAFVLHYTNNTWDNNGGSDYHITLSGPPPPQSFIMDGTVDTSARLAATHAGINLYLGWNGTDLYVATQSAQAQNGDIFVVITDSLHALQPAMWAKGGNVPGWKVFLGNESTNNWSGWFNSSGTGITTGVQSSAGTFLEGAVNLQTNFGTIPPLLYVAVGKYQTQDGGSLTAQAPAGNADGNIDTAELYHYNYAIAILPPAVPTLLAPVHHAAGQPLTSTLQWNATATATSYRLQVSTDSLFGITLMDDSSITTTNRIISGLAHLTTYYWRVRAKNAGGTSDFSPSWSFITVVPPPTAPLLEFPADHADSLSQSLILRWHPSPTAVTYHVQTGSDSLFTSIIVNDSTLSDTTKNIVTSESKYWRVRAKNAGGVSPWSDVRRFTTVGPSTIAVTVSLNAGWNMVSIPVEAADYRKTIIFPSALSSAFAYDGGYSVSDTLRRLKGYWIKLSTAQEIIITGIPHHADTVAVKAGWNLIGTISDSLRAASVTSSPAGIMLSSFFGFNQSGNGSSYLVTDMLKPGYGYWIKVNADGALYMQAPPVSYPSLRPGEQRKK